jgi:hypothetical protein
MRRALTLVFLGALMVTPALAQAAPGFVVPQGERLVLWARSDGTSGIWSLAQFQQRFGVESTQACTGVAPLASTCVLRDHTDSGSWGFGYVLPYVGGVASVLVGSAGVNLTGTQHMDINRWTVLDGAATVYWGCNFWLASTLGVTVGDANCGWIGVQNGYLPAYPAGDLTATFTVGAFDGRYPGVYGAPTRGDVEPLGIGAWAGILQAD